MLAGWAADFICVLRNTLTGSKSVVSISRVDPVTCASQTIHKGSVPACAGPRRQEEEE